MWGRTVRISVATPAISSPIVIVGATDSRSGMMVTSGSIVGGAPSRRLAHGTPSVTVGSPE